PGMGYVALSRVESLDGLYLTGINEHAFLVSPDAVVLDAGLRAESKAACARLKDEGPESFTKRAVGQEPEDEFSQDQLF
ncbi:MAG: ATP-dependent endonuclease, partial [Bifidobacterium sp.]|nr:ATP-dependent endonuclease [Bifidobacterium sp.]